MRQIFLTLFALLSTAASAQMQRAYSVPKRQYVEYIVRTSSPDRTYRTGQKAEAIVEAYLGGQPAEGQQVAYTLGDEMLPPADSGSVSFRQGRAVIPLGTMDHPGFRECRLRFTLDGHRYTDLVKVGFSPDEIRPVTPEPADFDAFWRKTMRQAAKVALDPQVTKLPRYSTDSIEVSLVRLTVGHKGRYIWGYMARPLDGRRHPVLLTPPGAGSKRIGPTDYYAKMGYVYLTLCIHSQCNPELLEADYEAARQGVADYWLSHIDSPEECYYRDVYAGVARAVDFLCSLPDWDGVNVGVTGGSQGGALTIVAAALNPRVTFCAPFYPALCDPLGYLYGRAGGWPAYFRHSDAAAAPEVRSTLGYYDVAAFAARLRCPTFLSTGYNDETCPPTSVFAAYNAITAPKTIVVTPTSGHWRYETSNAASVEWMRGQWKTGK